MYLYIYLCIYINICTHTCTHMYIYMIHTRTIQALYIACRVGLSAAAPSPEMARASSDTGMCMYVNA